MVESLFIYTSYSGYQLKRKNLFFNKNFEIESNCLTDLLAQQITFFSVHLGESDNGKFDLLTAGADSKIRVFFWINES